MPNEKHLNQILKDVVNAKSDAHPVFCLQGMRVVRKKNQLVLSGTE